MALTLAGKLGFAIGCFELTPSSMFCSLRSQETCLAMALSDGRDMLDHHNGDQNGEVISPRHRLVTLKAMSVP